MKDMGKIVDEIQSDANARDKAHVHSIDRRPPRQRPIPAPLAIDDLLELAARAKRTETWDLGSDEAFQLGDGLEILASDLEEERKQRAAEQAAREQVAQETATETVRLCGLIDELRYDLRERRSRIADLERRITAANDQAERDLDDAHAGNASSHRSPPSDNAAYELPDAEIAGFVASAREEQEATGIVHPLAALADRIEILHAGSEHYHDPVSGLRLRVVRVADFQALMAAVARR